MLGFVVGAFEISFLGIKLGTIVIHQNHFDGYLFLNSMVLSLGSVRSAVTQYQVLSCLKVTMTNVFAVYIYTIRYCINSATADQQGYFCFCFWYYDNERTSCLMLCEQVIRCVFVCLCLCVCVCVCV